MQHSKMFPYLIGTALVAAALAAVGAPLASILPFAVFLACPLMMVFMMRGMSGAHGSEDHTGDGCDHDATRKAEPSVPQAR